MQNKCRFCGYDRHQILITITDAESSFIVCPNCVAEHFEELRNLKENESFIDDITNKPGAIRYFSGDEEYFLNRISFLRLLAHNLTPYEYHILTKKYSEYNFQLHEDFYDDKGYAIQPMCEDAYTDALEFIQKDLGKTREECALHYAEIILSFTLQNRKFLDGYGVDLLLTAYDAMRYICGTGKDCIFNLERVIDMCDKLVQLSKLEIMSAQLRSAFSVAYGCLWLVYTGSKNI